MQRSAYATQHGSSYQTAWRMWQRGELPAYQLPSGTVLVGVPASPQAIRPQTGAVSARFSSAEHREHRAERVVVFRKMTQVLAALDREGDGCA
jgi:hypothetical protein